MTREDFIRDHPLERELERYGARLLRSGDNRVTNVCARETHKPGHLCCEVNLAKQVFFCHDCEFGGSVIDLIMVRESKTAEQVLGNGDGGNGYHSEPVRGFFKSKTKTETAAAAVEPKGKVVATYDYQDALGRPAFQVCRLEPKSFRQRHSDGNGGWVWGMDGVERVLYRLPEVLKAETVWLVEGEKDADNLVKLGFCATTNVGGAEKWLDAYTDMLAGKDVVVCGDNDEAGRAHVEKVFEALAGKVKTARLAKVPLPHKDASDWIVAGAKREDFQKLADETVAFAKGWRTPFFTMAEVEPEYARQVKAWETESLNLSRWLPSLGRHLRAVVPGEFVLLVGDTGIGKTAVAQNLAVHCKPLPTVMFELELPRTLMFERFVGIKRRLRCRDVEVSYRNGEKMGRSALEAEFPHLLVCDRSRLDLEQMEKWVHLSELRLGERPRVVIVDYVQLMAGRGSKRYERTSDNAEGLKVLAKECNVVLVGVSQVQRPEHKQESGTEEVGVHSGKDSGSLENSAGLVLGAWRDKQDATLLHLKVLKATKGGAVTHIKCNFDVETMAITERAEAWQEGEQ